MNKNAGNDQNTYWVVYERNSRLGSHKSMRLENKNALSKLINRNKIELNTEIGKNNRLTIYEVYNTSKFMYKQLKNPQYYNSTESDVFNVTPLYSSENKDLNVN